MLLFDLTATQPIGSIARHGGGNYAEIVFFKLAEKSLSFACYYDSSRWINPKILRICAGKNIKLHDLHYEEISMFSNSYTHLYSALPNSKTSKVSIHKIFTIHGLRILETPIDTFIPYYTKSWTQKIKSLLKFLLVKKIKNKSLTKIKSDYLWDKNNVELITVSNHSRISIELLIPEINKYKIPLQTYYAPDTSPKDTSKNFASYEKVPFYLMVSGNRWVKNCLRAIIAFDELVSSGYARGIKLKIAGAKREDIDYKFKNNDKIEFLGYVSDEELGCLFKHAKLFIYPSLNEGFGYPPLYAMKLSTPVIASCFTSISEICGDAVMYFNPLSILEIKNRLLQMEDENVRKEYVTKGLIRYKKILERQNNDLDDMLNYLLNYDAQ